MYLPSDKVTGLDMPDKRYDARPGDGYVEVDDLHAEVLKMYTGLKIGRIYTAAQAPGIVCSKCSFEQYRAMAGATCNKCGGAWATG